MNIEEFLEAEFWLRLLDSEFNCGFVAALILILGIMILMMLIRLVLWLSFRTRRCSTLVVPGRDGDIVISRQAVLDATSRELEQFAEVKVNRIQLYVKKHDYLMTIFCAFKPQGDLGMPELSKSFKPQIIALLKRVFGIENLKNIRVVIEEYKGNSSGKTASSVKSETTEAENIAAAELPPNVYSGF